MTQNIDRRRFMGVVAAGFATLVTPHGLPSADAGMTVHVDWLTARRTKGNPIGRVECHYRIEGGEWRTRQFAITQRRPIAWLTEEIGIQLHSSFWDDALPPSR